MRHRHFAPAALAAFLALPGCYAAHGRGDTGDTALPDAPADPAYATATTARPAPSAPGCGGSEYAPLAPAGLDDLRNPAIAALDSGFVASLVHATQHRGAYDYPTVAARMRSDLTGMLDAPHEAGIVTSAGGEVMRAALVAGGDHRLASCAVSDIDDAYDFVPGGVAFFHADGSLERVVRLAHGCADVAYIDGQWMAIEIAIDESRPDYPRNLVLFDDTLAIEQRIALGYGGDVASYPDRLAGANGRVYVVAPDWHADEQMVAVDLATESVTLTPFPFEAPIALTASQLALVMRDDDLGVAWITAAGEVQWARFDASLAPVEGPERLGDTEAYTSVIDVEAMTGGVAIAWAHAGTALTPLDLALRRDDGVVTRVDPQLPASVPVGIETMQLAVQGDVLAVAFDSRPPTAPGAVGIWSARCRVE